MEKGASQNRRRKRKLPFYTRAYTEPALSHRASLRHFDLAFMRRRSSPALSDKDPDQCPREWQLMESIMKFLNFKIPPHSDKHKSNEPFLEPSVGQPDLEKRQVPHQHLIPSPDMQHGAKTSDSGSTSPISPREAVALPPVEHEGYPSKDHAFAPGPRPIQEPNTRDHSLDSGRPVPSQEGSKDPKIQHNQPLGLQPSDPTELDSSWIAGLAPLISELVNQQRDASAARSHLREVRIALRHKRDEEAEYRATFMKRLNPLVSNGEFGAVSIDKGAIAAEYQALQTATQEYLDMENTYHQAEDKLGAQEYMLNKSMERLAKFSQGAKPPSYQDDEMFRPVVDDLIDDASSYNSTPQDLPVGIREYLSRIGDLQILQERLHNLDIQRASIIGRQEQRNMFHIPLDGESWEFLQSYEEERKETWEDLNQAHLDAAELEWICQENGILTDDYKNRLDYIYQFDIIYQRTEIGDVDIFSHVEDPLKFPTGDLETKEKLFFFEALPDGPDGAPPLSGQFNAPKVGKIDDSLKLSTGDLEAKEKPYFEALSVGPDDAPSLSGRFSAPKVDKGWFYNKWTWHQVCISTFQIHLLKGQFEFQKLLNEGMDDIALGELAEAEWFKDNPAASTKLISQNGENLIDDGPTISGSGLQRLRKHAEPVGSLGSFLYNRGGEIRSNRPQLSVAQELPT